MGTSHSNRARLGFRFAILGIAPLLLLSACAAVVQPQGEPLERAKAEAAGRLYEAPVNKRPLPDIKTTAPLRFVLEYAFMTNGELEAAYREWRAALERIPQAGARHDPRLEFSTLLGSENMMERFAPQLDEITLGVSQEFPGPGKRAARAELALKEAQVSSARFRKAKYDLQAQVIKAYADLTLNEALIRLTSESLAILQQAEETAFHRYHAMNADPMGGQALSDLRKLEVEIEDVQSELRSLAIMRESLIAQLNSLLNRKANQPIGAIALPTLNLTTTNRADLFERAVAGNAELEAMRKEIESRGAVQVLAELEKRPDFMVGGGAMAKLLPATQIMPMLSAGMTLPINRARIRAQIQEALAMRQATEAKYRSSAADVLANVIMALVGLADAERLLHDYRQIIVARTRELLDTQLTTYGAGGGDILDVLDTERLLLEFQELILRAETDRVRYLADLETAIGEELFRPAPAAPRSQEVARR